MKAGIYVHIPFCVRKCHYCSFNSIPYEKETASKYLVALSSEIDAAPEDTLALSIYIGGGTPTVLPGPGLLSLLERLREKFKSSKDVETTLEANPGTLGTLDLGKLNAAGVNRISLGVQSFDSSELKTLGRMHGAREVGQAVREIRASGIDNINLDLIYSLPGQDMARWSRSLNEAVRLKPSHISIYDLTLEAGTRLYLEFKAGKVVLPPESAQVEMYLHAVSFLEEAGYRRYEISNFAAPGRECVHNINYWSAGQYLGFGAGAHGNINRERTANIRDVGRYIAAIESGHGAVESREKPGPLEREREFIMLGLRKTDGFGLDEYRSRFGRDFIAVHGDKAGRLTKAGYMRLSGGRAYLTIKGVLASNSVIREFF